MEANTISQYLNKYLSIAVFFAIAAFVAIIVTLLPRILNKPRYNTAKLDSYECGFAPFGEARQRFDIRFCLISMLFIIFDIEIAFLIPWAINLGAIGKFGFFSMMFFLFVLTLGFLYEWRQGALEWK